MKITPVVFLDPAIRPVSGLREGGSGAPSLGAGGSQHDVGSYHKRTSCRHRISHLQMSFWLSGVGANPESSYIGATVAVTQNPLL